MSRRPVLVDSSIWIDHINHGHDILASLLKQRRVLTHPLIIGEIAMGSLKNRQKILREIGKLSGTKAVTNAEVMAMVEWDKLHNKGIGFIDAHLLASVKITENATLLTKDGRLHAQAKRLGVAFAAA